jgi:hypothetical protein
MVEAKTICPRCGISYPSSLADRICCGCGEIFITKDKVWLRQDEIQKEHEDKLNELRIELIKWIRNYRMKYVNKVPIYDKVNSVLSVDGFFGKTPSENKISNKKSNTNVPNSKGECRKDKSKRGKVRRRLKSDCYKE